MSDYSDFIRVTTAKHCGSRTEHAGHRWHESGVGFHRCTGNHLPRPAPSGEAAEPTTTDGGE